MMNSGRDWHKWPEFELHNDMAYIGKSNTTGRPMPMAKSGFGWNYTRNKETPIFCIKAWGKDGYR